MILNNYNNSLRENVETDLSFKSDRSPHVFVRQFKCVLDDGDEHLIVPYYVCDSEDCLYVNSEIGPTFTTIVAFDENTIDSRSVEIPTVKRTTFSGSFVFDFDLAELGVNAPGMHSFSIRCIQDNGVGSATVYYRFLIRDAVEDAKVLDLDSVSSFSTSQAVNDDYTLHYNKAVTMKNKSDGTTRPFIESDYANYSVSVVKDGDDVSYISIGVTGSLKYISQSYVRDDVTLTGTYLLTTKATVDGVEEDLVDYLDTPNSELPSEVILAAAKNKVALTMLMRAAKVYGKNKLILPEGMTIVFDYRNREGLVAKNTEYDKDSYDNVNFPDGFTLDLNGSTICALHSPYVSNGYVLRMFNNFDTHVINGYVKGNYKNHQFGANPQSMHVVGMRGATMFCSFDNVDVSYGLGYELTLKKWQPIAPSGSKNVEQMPKFNNYGYIDYDGVVHNEEGPNDDYCVRMMYTGEVGNARSDYPDSTWYGLRFLGPGGTEVFSDSLIITKPDEVTFESPHRGVGMEAFIHYYDENNEFIKTVKVYVFNVIICPYGAKYARLSMKGMKAKGNIDSLTYNSSANVGAFKILRFLIPWGNSYSSCKVHDIRTCVVGMLGAQSSFDNCYLWNIADIPEYKPNSVTPKIFDYEESTYYNHSVYMHNNSVLYGDNRYGPLYGSFKAEITDNHGLTGMTTREAGVFCFRMDGMFAHQIIRYVGNRYPIHFTHITNSDIDEFKSASWHDQGTSDGASTVQYSHIRTVLKSKGSYDVYGNNSIIEQIV